MISGCEDDPKENLVIAYENEEEKNYIKIESFSNRGVKNKMKDENVDIIETYVMFSTDISINVKMKKVTRYGSSESEYKFVEIAGISGDEIVENSGMDVLGKIREKALYSIKEYEDEIKT